MSTARWLVVGAGFTGAVLAELIASTLGQSVLLIDRREHIGGNAFDSLDAAGVLVHRYGPHIFHTNSQRVFNYLSRFTSWRPYEHRVLGLVDGQMIPVPFNLTSLEMLLGPAEGGRVGKVLMDEFGAEANVPILKMRESHSRDVRRIADFVYEKVFLHYTTKQWGFTPEDLDASVSSRVPVRLSRDDRYFQDTFQQMPSEGYARLFDRMLAHDRVEIGLGLHYADVATSERFERIIFTGPIDEFFGDLYGPLPYRSFDFRCETIESEHPVQACGVYNYPTPAGEHPYTRKTEFRHLTGQSKLAATTVMTEHPCDYVPGVNEPYYPVPREESRARYRLYEAQAVKERGVIFAGRLADYSYYNMDQAVGRALSAFDKQVLPSHSVISA